LWATAEKCGVQAFSLLTLSILAKLLEVRDFGLIAMAGVFLSLLNLVSDQGIGTAIIQRHELDESHLNSAFWANLALGAVLAAAAVAVAGEVASFYREPGLSPILVCLSARFLVQPFSIVPRALLARRLQFRETALRSLLSRSSAGVVGIAVALAGGGVWSLVAQELTGVLAEVVVLWRLTSWRPHWRFSWRHWLELVTFGIRITGLSLTSFLHYQLAPLLLGYLAGAVALGYYAIGFRMLQAFLQMLQGVVSTVALPAFSRLQGDLVRLRQLYYESSSLVSLVSFPVFAGLIVTAPELVSVMFGPEWAPSVPVLQVLSISGFVITMLAPSGPALMALNKPAWLLKFSILGAAVNLVLLLPAARWGIVAAAAAHSVRCYLLAPFNYFAVARLLRVDWREYWRGIVPSALGALSVVGVASMTRALLPDWLGPGGTLACLAILGAATYTLVVYKAGPELVRTGRDFAITVLRSPEAGSNVEGQCEAVSLTVADISAEAADSKRIAP